MIRIVCPTYDEWKDIVLTKKLLKHQHVLSKYGTQSQYFLFAVENNSISYECTIISNDDVIDYETNYSLIANQNITDSLIINTHISGNYLQNKIIKHQSDFSGWDESCNTSEWTLTIDKSFSPSILLESLNVTVDHNHYAKVEINSIVIFEENLLNLYNMHSTNWSYINNKYFQMFKGGNQTGLIFNFDSFPTSNIKIYQKRRSGNGNLHINEMFISYREA